MTEQMVLTESLVKMGADGDDGDNGADGEDGEDDADGPGGAGAFLLLVSHVILSGVLPHVDACVRANPLVFVQQQPHRK